MLNERQLKIVDLLEQQPRTPGELAQQTGVSGRTILRDIDYLNFTLNGKARISASGSAGYQLEIFERRSFFQLLQKHDNDDRLLALLLLNTFTPRAQLASALNLPETWVAERLPRLKQRYERTCCLASRPGLGHFIDETEEKRVILLANLLRKDPVFNTFGWRNTRQPSAFIHGLRQPTPLAAHAGGLSLQPDSGDLRPA